MTVYTENDKRRNNKGQFGQKDWSKYLGCTYGELTIINFETPQEGKTTVNCVCSCGNKFTTVIYPIIKGKKTSCGSCRKSGIRHPYFMDLTGHIYGRLTVINYVGKLDTKRRAYWNCICSCGNKNVLVLSTALRSGKTQSCGCYQKDQVPKGINHYKFDQSISDKERLERTENRRSGDVKFKTWSLAIKKRDNFTCQICRSTKSGQLRSHHLYNWKKYPSMRYILENGVCLCRKCHEAFHSKFGKEDNTPEQFRLFKESFMPNL